MLAGWLAGWLADWLAESMGGICWEAQLPTVAPFPACLVQPYTRSMAYDPEGAYLASVNADGTLNVWEIESGKQLLCRRKACPKVSRRAAEA